jgi:hypothetical protein
MGFDVQLVQQALQQAHGDEARAAELILSGQVVLEQKQQPIGSARQQLLQQLPVPAPSPQEQPMHDVLRDGFTISKRLYVQITSPSASFHPSHTSTSLQHCSHA